MMTSLGNGKMELSCGHQQNDERIAEMIQLGEIPVDDGVPKVFSRRSVII